MRLVPKRRTFVKPKSERLFLHDGTWSGWVSVSCQWLLWQLEPFHQSLWTLAPWSSFAPVDAFSLEPQDRQPIATYVIEYENSFCRVGCVPTAQAALLKMKLWLLLEKVQTLLCWLIRHCGVAFAGILRLFATESMACHSWQRRHCRLLLPPTAAVPPCGITASTTKSGTHTCCFTDGDEAELKAGEREGRCTYSRRRFTDGSVYEGEWKAGKREGRGTFRFTDGSVYEGEWKADLAEGRGTYHDANGSVYEGEWKAGKGRGVVKYVPQRRTYRNADGSVYYGVYYEGEWRAEPSRTAWQVPLHQLSPIIHRWQRLILRGYRVGWKAGLAASAVTPSPVSFGQRPATLRRGRWVLGP